MARAWRQLRSALPRLAAGLLLSGAIAAVGWRARALTTDGAVAAVGVGTACFVGGGWSGSAALVAFFASGSVLSRMAGRLRPGAAERAAKGARRDARQVLANGGVAALAALLPGSREAMLGALAAAAADTWATEVGLLLGREPRLLLVGPAVEAGTSGGMTVVGLIGGVGGELLVALAHLALKGRLRDPAVACALPAVLPAGLAGSLADSLLGATLQAKYRCPRCGLLTERRVHCGGPTARLGGLAWLDNDGVNLLATVVGAAVALALRRRGPSGRSDHRPVVH